MQLSEEQIKNMTDTYDPTIYFKAVRKTPRISQSIIF